ncbi:hypothetical protein EDB89DRAFT_1470052 [Lactarius sanguifluus]|nr:hypothetical protein EDB89DRAFT_1470052 [Lactarius sanguifluus]
MRPRYLPSLSFFGSRYLCSRRISTFCTRTSGTTPPPPKGRQFEEAMHFDPGFPNSILHVSSLLAGLRGRPVDVFWGSGHWHLQQPLRAICWTLRPPTVSATIPPMKYRHLNRLAERPPVGCFVFGLSELKSIVQSNVCPRSILNPGQASLKYIAREPESLLA